MCVQTTVRSQSEFDGREPENTFPETRFLHSQVGWFNWFLAGTLPLGLQSSKARMRPALVASGLQHVL